MVTERTLFLGDTNLKDVKSTDLGENCYIRTINGANIDLMRCWVTEKLNWSPSRCILYCGINDIIDGLAPNTILDNLGTMITELKNVNESMQIYICQLVPTLRADEYEQTIHYYNNQLHDWSVTNGVTILETQPSFKLGTGEVDDLCFYVDNDNPGIFLNRYGVTRLLTTINKQCTSLKLCNDWSKIRREQMLPTNNTSIANKKFNPPVVERNYFHNPDNMYQRYNRNITLNKNRHYNRSNISQNISNKPNSYHRQTFNEYNRDTTPNENQHYDRSNISQNIPNRPGSYHRQTFNRRGCYNCGEFNHVQSNCRFDHVVRCNTCNRLGHKTRLCSKNSD